MLRKNAEILKKKEKEFDESFRLFLQDTPKMVVL
jgi:hypothetical protein